MKGALKAVHLREAVRADVVLWKHEKQVCKSELGQHYPKVLPPSLFPSFLSPWSPHTQAALELSVSYTGHKLVIFLSHPPQWWDYGSVPPYLARTLNPTQHF